MNPPTFVEEQHSDYYGAITKIRHTLKRMSLNNHASYGVGIRAEAECGYEWPHAKIDFGEEPDCKTCLEKLIEEHKNV